MYVYNKELSIVFNLINDNNTIINEKIYIKECPICKKEFSKVFGYNNNNYSMHELNIHLYLEHNFINLYEYNYFYNKNRLNNILKKKTEYIYLHSNNFNMLNALYEYGSNKIYINYTDQHNIKHIFYKKKDFELPNLPILYRFTEHSGYIKLSGKKIDKIVINTEYLTDNADPEIFLPENYSEQLRNSYIFHTHPKTPDIASRFKDGILYEFPSISDLLHYVDHHNEGKLIGSLVITPEGIYNIRKYDLNKQKIIFDDEIFIKDIETTYYEILDLVSIKYKNKNITKEFFYNNIATDFSYIKIINNKLQKYDLFVEYYPRILVNNHYILPNLFFPIF